MSVRRATDKDTKLITDFLSAVATADVSSSLRMDTTARTNVAASVKKPETIYWLAFDGTNLQGILRLVGNGVSLFDPKEVPWAEKGRVYSVGFLDLMVALPTLTDAERDKVFAELALFAANDTRDSGTMKEVMMLVGPAACRAAAFARKLGTVETGDGPETRQVLPTELLWDNIPKAKNG